jgi:butyrate kinase
MSGLRVLAVNPGATSTKAGIFEGDREVRSISVPHGDAELAAFAGRPVLDQLDMREAALRAALGADTSFDAVSGRGGLLQPVPGGTYLVDDDMLADLRAARRGEHASSLGPFLAARIAAASGCAALIVDPVSVDEWDDVARYSGLAGVERESLSHALNSKAIARRHAQVAGQPYDALRLVVVHMGSGITVSAHADGRMIDACNSMDEGPFAMDRAGGLPVTAVLRLAVEADGAALRRRIFGAGGVHSYLGTRDLREVLRRVAGGDDRAARVLEAMWYQTAKEAGAMASVLRGRVDAVLLTGGMMHAAEAAAALGERLSWIAPVHVYPGEDELHALAAGALRVLRGEESARRYAEYRRA